MKCNDLCLLIYLMNVLAKLGKKQKLSEYLLNF